MRYHQVDVSPDLRGRSGFRLLCEQDACVERPVPAAQLSVEQKNRVVREFIDYMELWSSPDFPFPPALKVHLRIGSLASVRRLTLKADAQSADLAGPWETIAGSYEYVSTYSMS